jgi:hypothetical protein
LEPEDDFEPRRSIRRDDPGIAVFYRWLIIGGIAFAVLTVVAVVILILGPGQGDPLGEVPAGGAWEVEGRLGAFRARS